MNKYYLYDDHSYFAVLLRDKNGNNRYYHVLNNDKAYLSAIFVWDRNMSLFNFDRFLIILSEQNSTKIAINRELIDSFVEQELL